MILFPNSSLFRLSGVDSVGFNFSISDEFRENQYVLSSTIQELIDNVFKHNNLDEENPIEIKIYTENDSLIIYNSVVSKNVTDSKEIIEKLEAIEEEVRG